MAAKPTKIKTTTKKSLPKDPPTLDSDQVELLRSVPAPYPAKQAKVSKKLCMRYYKQKAHYFQNKFEGTTSEIGACSDISYYSSEEEKGMIYNYDVKNRDGTCLSKSNLENRGKIAYHKVKDKTLLDFVKNKESEGCTSLPLASAQTLYPRLTTFLDNDGMTALCKPMPQRLRNELSADLLLN